MNKKFFAALASATMAFTASGSIAVFADDFVEESNVVDPGDIKPVEKEVVWNEDNFGALVGGKVTFTDTSSEFDASALKVNDKVKTADLKTISTITLDAKFEGEVKGLEYFTGLTSFEATATNVKVTNATLDFSANTKLETLKVTKAADLTGITLPGTYKNDKDKDVHALTSLTLDGTKLTSLDLSEQEELDEIFVRENRNLKDLKLREATSSTPIELTNLGLRDNALESINLDRYTITGRLNLEGNHIGVLNLSKTNAPAGANTVLGTQKFYVSEDAANVNLKEAFADLDVDYVKTTPATAFDSEKGVLDLVKATEYKYETNVKGGATTSTLTVKLEAANPMNRLYNPNSGEHFYTADLEEKAALVNLGWQDEGYGWVAPSTDAQDAKKGKPVYRLYNANAGDHHYTMDSNEVKTLVAYGWKDEGTGWYSASDAAAKVEVYRQYNPYANGAGSHNYTTDKAENDYLVSLGWIYEGAAWKALR